MRIGLCVDAFAGYPAKTRQFRLNDIFEIVEVEDRWYEPETVYFRVRTTEGKRYILRLNEREDEWTLQSGFDGAELLARPGIELITVDPATVRKAESQIAGCERCRLEESELPFDSILGDVLGKHGAFEFNLSEPAHCPNCKATLTEKTLVEPHGGIEIQVAP